MADEAKIVFELVDRSGQGVAGGEKRQPGASDVSGSNTAKDFDNRVVNEGANANQGKGSVPSGSAPSIEIKEPPKEEGVRVNTSNTNLESTIKSILEKAPDTTPDELHNTLRYLGASSKEATDYVNRTFNQPQQPDTQPPSSPYKSIWEEVDAIKKPDISLDLKSFAERVTNSQKTFEDTFKEDKEKLNKAKEAGLLTEEQFSKHSDKLDKEFEEKKKQQDSSHEKVKEASSSLSNELGLLSTAIRSSGITNLFSTLGGSAGNVISNTINSLSGAVSNAAYMSNLTSSSEGTEGGSSVMSKLMGVAPVLGVTAAAVGSYAYAASVVQNDIERTKGKARYSPELIQAEVEAQIEEFIADIEMSNTLGSNLAEYTRKQSKFNVESQKLFSSFKAPFIDALSDTYEAGTDIASGLNSLKEYFSKKEFMGIPLDQIISNATTGIISPPLVTAWINAKKMANIDKEEPHHPVENSPFNWFMGQEHLPLPKPFNEAPVSDMKDIVFNPTQGLRL